MAQGIGTQFEPQQDVSVRLQAFSGEPENQLQPEQPKPEQLQQPLVSADVPGAAAGEFARYLVQRRRPVDHPAEIQKRFSDETDLPDVKQEQLNSGMYDEIISFIT